MRVVCTYQVKTTEGKTMGNNGICSASTSGSHDIEWVRSPAHLHNGSEVIPEMERGFCWYCNEFFTR